MRFSVFTASHNAEHLPRAWRSLQAQTLQNNWEWVVLPNGEKAGEVVDYLNSLHNSKISILPVAESGSVGKLKNMVCAQTQGDILVELDHDDELTPDCLEELQRRSLSAKSDKYFLFSDCLTLDKNGDSVCWNQNYGWRYYRWQYHNGNETVEKLVNASFPVTPRSLAEIYYAPDHVRAWSREAYTAAGGHSPMLKLGDDHELLIKTYLSQAEFLAVNKPLYIHHLHDKSTCRQPQNTDEIGRVSRSLCEHYLPALVREWCRRESLAMLDLGGEFNCPEGYLPVDINLSENKKGFRLDALQLDRIKEISSLRVGCVRAWDFLEHIPSNLVCRLMNTIYETLEPCGFLLSMTPAISDSNGIVGRGAFQDPTHVSFWSENNTWYFTNRNFSRYVPKITCRFQTVVCRTFYPSEWHHQHRIPYLLWYAMALPSDKNIYFPGVVAI